MDFIVGVYEEVDVIFMKVRMRMVILVYDNSKLCVDIGYEIKFMMRMGILMVDIIKLCVDVGMRWSLRWKKVFW